MDGALRVIEEEVVGPLPVEVSRARSSAIVGVGHSSPGRDPSVVGHSWRQTIRHTALLHALNAALSRQQLSVMLSEDQRCVGAAKSERIGKRDIDRLRFGFVRNQVDGGFNRQVVEVERWRQN